MRLTDLETGLHGSPRPLRTETRLNDAALRIYQVVDLKGTVHSKGSAEWITWRRTSFPESLHLPWAKGESVAFRVAATREFAL